MIVKEIREMLAETETLNYFDRQNVEPTEFTKEKVENHFKEYIKAEQAQIKLTLQVTAYSLCPDYVSFVAQLLEPFTIKYADLMKYVDFQYVSMAKTDDSNVAKATSMHGQLEAHMDLIYLCTQKHAKQQFVDTQICYTQSEHCLMANVVDEETVADIELCAIEQPGQQLLKESQKFIADKKVGWSPTILVDGEEKCQWALGEG